MPAETPPNVAEVEENSISLFCTKSKAHVAVGRQLNTDVEHDITRISYSAASSKSGAPTTTESKETPRLVPNAASDCELCEYISPEYLQLMKGCKILTFLAPSLKL